MAVTEVSGDLQPVCTPDRLIVTRFGGIEKPTASDLEQLASFYKLPDDILATMVRSSMENYLFIHGADDLKAKVMKIVQSRK